MKKLLTTVGFAVLFGCTQEPAPQNADSPANQQLAPENEEPTVPSEPAMDEPVTEAPAPEEPATEEPKESAKLNAETVLANAIAMAAKDDRRVFVHLGAPW